MRAASKARCTLNSPTVLDRQRGPYLAEISPRCCRGVGHAGCRYAYRRRDAPASRHSDEPLLSGFLAWRVGLVSALFLAGIFGIFTWSRRAGLSLEEARTSAVNTLVVMEIFYLLSVRYLRVASLTLEGVLGTKAVLIGLGGVARSARLHLRAVHAGPVRHAADRPRPRVSNSRRRGGAVRRARAREARRRLLPRCQRRY